MNRDEIMKALAFSLLQGLHQKRGKSYFSRRKIVETALFLELKFFCTTAQMKIRT
jgi:hypothetical protein